MHSRDTRCALLPWPVESIGWVAAFVRAGLRPPHEPEVPRPMPRRGADAIRLLGPMLILEPRYRLAWGGGRSRACPWHQSYGVCLT